MAYRILDKGDVFIITDCDINLDGDVVDYVNMPVSLYAHSEEELIQLVADIYLDISRHRKHKRKVSSEEYYDEYEDEVTPVDELFR